MTGQKLPISASVITYNEEKKIRHCLKSLDFCYEIIVVDSGSTDRTRQIAEEMGAKVYFHPFEGYRAQKQWALDRCTSKWVISLDADEWVTEGLRDFLYNIDFDTCRIHGFEVRRRHIFLGRKMGHSTLYPDYKLRIVRKENARWDGIYLHERLFVEGETKKIPYDIIHHPWSDSWEYLDTQFKYSRIMANEKYEAGKRAGFSDLALRPLYTFFYRYFIRLGILDGFPGFVISAGGAFTCLTKYLFLWEIERKGRVKSREHE